MDALLHLVCCLKGLSQQRLRRPRVTRAHAPRQVGVTASPFRVAIAAGAVSTNSEPVSPTEGLTQVCEKNRASLPPARLAAACAPRRRLHAS